MILPLSPTISLPVVSIAASLSISAGRGGRSPPSYHVSVTGGIFSRAANSYVTIDASGYVSSFTRDELTSTLSGGPSFSARKTASSEWHPMSPRAPVPKSHQPRHLNGTYAGLYGRSGAGPSHMSQSSVEGTGGVSVGRPIPCGQYSLKRPFDGRSVQACTSRTFPIAPSQIVSHNRRVPSDAWPWLPICVITLYLRAASAICRASQTECVSGFSQYTCLPIFIASIDANA